MTIHRCRSLAALAVGLLTLAVMHLGCEDEPSMTNLDRYFADNPYLSDPRDTVATQDDVEISPTSATVSSIGQKILFTLEGGDGPFTWDVANTDAGEVAAVSGNDRQGLYKSKTLDPNNVIASDEDGRSAIADIVYGAVADFQVVPSTSELTATNTASELSGSEVQFTAVGGTSPYGLWVSSSPTLGTIDADTGLFTVASPLTTFGTVTISITDSAGDIATGTLTLKRETTP